MIAANHNRCGHFALGNEFVEFQSGQMPFAITQPADARGQTLKRHALLGHANPAFQRFIFGEQFQNRFVGAEQILFIATQRHPAKRPFAFAEQRADKRRHEARIVERILYARIEGALPQIVAVIKHDRAALLKVQHCLHVPRHRRARSARKLGRITLAQSRRFFQR